MREKIGSGITIRTRTVIRLKGVWGDAQESEAGMLPERTLEEYFEKGLYAYPRLKLAKHRHEPSLEYETARWYAEQEIRLIDHLKDAVDLGDLQRIVGYSIQIGELRKEAHIKFQWERRILWQRSGANKGNDTQRADALARREAVRKAYEASLQRTHSVRQCCEKAGLSATTVYRAYAAIGQKPPHPKKAVSPATG